jgi:hypothetical protein
MQEEAEPPSLIEFRLGPAHDDVVEGNMQNLR